ncbi:MAG: HAD-IIIA family hydrolase [Candidatus Cloacimonetes bacterium]|nr:HAD-IIIA family hydrolase [Candidatus Cloacimonadota bacterium]
MFKKIIRKHSEVPAAIAPALCLDLDGTIRRSKSGEYINGPDDIELYPGTEEIIWQYREQGYLIFGVSNQGGVAFGFKDQPANLAEIERTLALFKRNPFHSIQFSLHHQEGSLSPFNYRSLLRKPETGMLAVLEVEAWNNGYVVNWKNSLLVGDRPEDQECAALAGIQFRWAYEFFQR